MALLATILPYSEGGTLSSHPGSARPIAGSLSFVRKALSPRTSMQQGTAGYNNAC